MHRYSGSRAGSTRPRHRWTRCIAWVDEILSIAFRTGRASRARLLWVGGATTVVGYAEERERSMRRFAAPLVPVLEEGRRTGLFPDADPEPDAATINAIAWSAIAGFATSAGPRLGPERGTRPRPALRAAGARRTAELKGADS